MNQPMTTSHLKLLLEKIWDSHRIACPSHLVRWNTVDGYIARTAYGDLFYKKGRLVNPKKIVRKISRVVSV